MIDSDDLMGGEAIIEIVENQLAENNPTSVKETLMRLMLEGIDREEAIQYIACALCIELEDVVNNQVTFNMQRYSSNLNALPEMPWAKDL